jgi:peptidoglycan hydrolase CwlO-like protein
VFCFVMEKLEKDRKKLTNLVGRIGEVEQQLVALDQSIDTHVKAVLAATEVDDSARKRLTDLHAEEAELAEDLAQRRAAAVVLRQRLRVALLDAKASDEPSHG